MNTHLRSASMALAVCALFAPGAWGQQEEAVALTWPGAEAGSRPKLRILATTSLPRGAVLTLVCQRQEERWVNGRMVRESGGPENSVRASQALAGGKTSFFDNLDRSLEPGDYRVTVEVKEDLQEPKTLEAVRTKAGKLKWEFQFSAWGDRFLPEAGRHLRMVDDLVIEVRQMIEMYEAQAKECKSTEEWKKQYAPKLAKKTESVFKKLGETPAHRYYAAAIQHLKTTLGSLLAHAALFEFKNGKLATATDYHVGNKSKTDEEFTFEILRKEIETASDVAGRELALWVVKDVRRGGSRDTVLQALREGKDHAGLAPYVERLEDPKTEWGSLEGEIRREKDSKK